jgi:fucose permease
MYYALTLNVGALPGDIFINAAVSAAVEIPAQFATILALNHHVTGRRLTCAVSMLCAGAFSFAVIPFITAGISSCWW